MIFDHIMMNRFKKYRVPDVLDVLYADIVNGLYFPLPYGSVKNRILISKCNIACDLLINSLMSEDHISQHLDFNNLENFRISFKDFLGITPMEFRKRFSI